MSKPTSLYTNALIGESSPYLLQHAHNPVNWHPWSNTILQTAQQEDRLIIISIGYAACHWCHVMEHESFENEQVAGVMNSHYVSIKIDREERPDIDQVYMDAVHLMGQQGGWPLNVIALPDGRPIFAGTYFRKEDWINVLRFFVKMYEEKKEELITRAQQVTDGLQTGNIKFNVTKETAHSSNDLHALFKNWLPSFDREKGGSSGAPKFPMPATLLYLLRHTRHSDSQETAKNILKTTLDHMAAGGIYDQIGGGFARYSTDEDWLVPHFEKMLYDNAQLISVYSEAFLLFNDEEYARIVRETIAFCNRELRSSEGTCFSSLDADSEGEEGRYYVWTTDELESILGSDTPEFIKRYRCTTEGNWEHEKNILHLDPADLSNSASDEKWKKRLLEARSTRARPGLDDKTLTSWNALMARGLVDAYKVLKEESYLQQAITLCEFIHNTQWNGELLFRNYKNGKSSIPGFLDDYALTIDAWVALYKVTLNEEWIQRANELTEYVLIHFGDHESPLLYYTSDLDPPLINRSKEISDNVIPASNSVMAKNLYNLGRYLDKYEWLTRSESMLNQVKAHVIRYPAYHANWAVILNWFINEPFEVAITGSDAMVHLETAFKQLDPDTLLMGTKDGQSDLPLLSGKFKKDRTLIYACKNKTCGAPVETIGDLVM
ncbi:MAG: thioredoxin domain-containing protein [Flavobacteriales bacterium]|nr:thioredoxin domain-containing protein [Flavobacteriales bacterium]